MLARADEVIEYNTLCCGAWSPNVADFVAKVGYGG
jgi:hypothetical protein